MGDRGELKTGEAQEGADLRTSADRVLDALRAGEPWRSDERSDDELFRVALMEKDDSARSAAVFALRYRVTREVFDRSLALCHGRLAKERSCGLNILAQFGGWPTGDCSPNPFIDETVDLFEEMVRRERRKTVLGMLAWALGEVGDQRAIGPLIALSKHPDPDVRVAATALGRYSGKSETALRGLIELCRDADRDVRDWATFELGSLYDPEFDQLDTPAAHEVLWERAEEDDYEIRCQALRGLVFRGEKGLADHLIHELCSSEFTNDVLEAAEFLRDPELLPHLLPLREWRNMDHSLLEDAIEACGGERLSAGR